MRRPLRFLAVLCTTLAVAGAAQAQPLSVRIDQATKLGLPGTARDVVVGNPDVADVTVVDGRTLILLGKSFGVTNLLVMDSSGRTILDRQVVVSASDDGRVSYYRGPNLQTYACAPRCERTSGEGGENRVAASPSGVGGE